MNDRMLEARVKAYNRAGEFANKLSPDLIALFTPLLGKKIIKSGGGMMEKVKKLLPELPNTPSISVTRYYSSYRLAWVVKTSEMCSETSCIYAEVTVQVGRLQNDVLESIETPEVFRTDYSAEEVNRLREDYREKKKVAEKASSALFPFGEYDR